MLLKQYHLKCVFKMFGLWILWVCIFEFVTVLTTRGVLNVMAVRTTPHKSTPIEMTRRDYIQLETRLWKKLNSRYFRKETELQEVYSEHHNFVLTRLQVDSFNASKYDILKREQWNTLKSELLRIEDRYETFMALMMTHGSSSELVESDVMSLCNKILRNDATFSMEDIFKQSELVMVKQTLYYTAMVNSKEEICNLQQSPQQFVYSLYTDIASMELKGYIMMQFAWMMQRIYNKDNHAQQAAALRADSESRANKTLNILYEILLRSDRTVWRCDPRNYVDGITYAEVTRLLQGYVENEINMNPDQSCRETCDYYTVTRSERCESRDNQLCTRQQKCTGQIYDCVRLASDMKLCPENVRSQRRYQYIKYKSNGSTLGKQSHCAAGVIDVDWWHTLLLYRCDYCFCLCDETITKSDRYFNLRPTMSDVKRNKVITGIRFVKHNRIFHLQIQEGQLLPHARINASTVTWKPVDNYNIYSRSVRNAIDYHTLNYEKRAIDLDDVEDSRNAFVVTGVRFRLLGHHLNLEVAFNEYDFESGLMQICKNCTHWKSIDNTDSNSKRDKRRQKIQLFEPDISTLSYVPSLPDSNLNQFIDFTPTSIGKDLGQTTVPFIDIQDVVTNPPMALAGIGIYHKGRRGYGGFIAPKIITYDLTYNVKDN